jgi:predicted DNA-binding transcriptional regulator YafY
MAAALLAAPPGADPGSPPDSFAAIARRAPQLSDGEVRLLAHAVERGTPVRIRYTNASGRSSARVIDPIDLDGHLLEAWCHLRDDERIFALDRIEAVSPA